MSRDRRHPRPPRANGAKKPSQGSRAHPAFAPTPPRQRTPSALGWLLAAAAATVAIALITGFAANAWGWLVAWLLALNGATWLAFAADKRAARRQRARWPERSLLLLSLLGGSPAALVASRVHAHKTRKTSFLRILWSIASLHLLIAALVVFLHWG